jgi:colanic acid/amylovoran biosynthesis glycosyltransferase
MPDRERPFQYRRPVAYVLQSFPALTQTFVYREVLGLRARGLEVATFATWRPDEAMLSQEARHLVDSTYYVFPMSWARFVRAHLHFLSRSPHKYVGTLAFVLSQRGESLRNRRRTLFHFCEAVYLALEMERRGVGHVHAHFCINAATIALVVSRLLDIPFSFTAHNILFTDRILLQAKIKAARFVVAISEFTRKFMLRLVPAAAAGPWPDHRDEPEPAEEIAAKIRVIHCGIAADAFVPADPRPGNEVPILLFVAQLRERKGAPVLVEACRILAERGLRFRCVIVGDGPQKPLIEQLVQCHALQEVVDLPGAVFQQDLRGYLRQADVFVLPCLTASNGDRDGVPVSLMEAMAMEIATVSTRISGIPELVEDGISGLLVPEQDAPALADALQRLLEDGELRSRLAKAGREKVVRDFDIGHSTAQLAMLLTHSLRANRL